MEAGCAHLIVDLILAGAVRAEAEHSIGASRDLG